MAGYGLSINANCGGKIFGGPSDPTPLDCPATPPLKEVLEAACDNSACSIDSISPPDQNGFISLGVVGNQEGDTFLRVRARGGDGSELSSTFPISFIIATDLHVLCDGTLTTAGLMIPPSGQCGGHYPVFTDSVWRWRVGFASAAGDLFGSVTANIVGDGVTSNMGGTYLTMRSGSSPSMVEVQIASRQFMKSLPVRVISLADVATGELQLVSNAVPSDGVEQEMVTVGPAPTTLWFGDSHNRLFDGDPGNLSIRPLLTLTDGSTAFGGAGLFVSDNTDVLRLLGLDAGGTPLQLTSLQLDLWGLGSAVANASIGAAQITWPIQIVSRLGM